MTLSGSLLGQTLTWQRIHDPPGAWGLLLDDQVVAEFSWSGSEKAVRVEIDADVRRMRLRGSFPVRATLTRGSQEMPDLVYAGGIRRGLALCREGAGFVLTCRVERDARRPAGPLGRRRARMRIAFEDTLGRTVVSTSGRGGGLVGFGNRVAVTSEPRYRDYLSRLLSVWGGLQILISKHRSVAVCAPFLTEAAAQRGIAELEPLMSATPGSRTFG